MLYEDDFKKPNTLCRENYTVYHPVVAAGDFNIYTREAGAGGLSIAVEGPSKAEIDFQDRKDGSCGVTYTVAEPGRGQKREFLVLLT